MSKTITIKGAYGESNFGDDLLMKVFESYFKEEFNVSPNFQGVDVAYPKKMLDGSSYNKVMSGKVDLLVYGGGTQFFAFSTKNSTTLQNKILRAFKNPNFLIKKIGERLRLEKNERNEGTTYKHIAFLGIGLGPFSDNQIVVEKTKNTLDSALFTGVRDQVSKKFCDEWGINSVLGADVVFSSYFESYLEDDLIRVTHRESKKIGIIVRDWDWDEDGGRYYQPLIDLANSDSKYEFIIFAPYKDKVWLNKLAHIRKVVWNPELDTISSFLHLLNGYSGFISARYHGAIIAALLNKPVVCVEVEDKLRILTQQIPEMKLWEKPFQKEQLEKLLKFENEQVDYTKSIASLRNLANTMLVNFKNTYNDENES